MMTRRNRFNLYLCGLVALALAAGCQSHKDSKDKQVATLRVHLQVIPEPMDFSTKIVVDRKDPTELFVDKSPFLTEANVAGAKVVDVAGGYDLQIKFDRQGTWLLENYTTTNPDKHLAIFSAFVSGNHKQARWLGAPVIRRRISDGILQFTPDASREEAEAIAVGLNNAAKKNRKDSEW
jgi:preprotein translocase subunit SecD